MADYDKPPELYDGLRLHQNENTGGCSPRVLEALARMRPEDVAFYPPYSGALEAVASCLAMPSEQVALTNGLDEGIMAVAIAYLRPRVGDTAAPEAIVPLPAFEIFAFSTSVVGGQTVPVMPRPDFAFALEEVLAAITPRTRAVFITNPNNPTGVAVPIDAIRRVAAAVPHGAVVFVDEAYVDFGGRTFIPDIAASPNVIVGRTFAKAYGLAGLRLGAVVGAPVTLEPVRRAIGVYSVNAAAVVAIQAALADREFVNDYLRQVRESKALTYAACERLGLKYWPSDANFVLIRIGDRTPELVAAAAARGIYVRDRSNEPGCAGCIRLTTGIVEHTRRGLAAMEEVLCAAR
jgi:histidinol-phosphate aminotransferase